MVALYAFYGMWKTYRLNERFDACDPVTYEIDGTLLFKQWLKEFCLFIAWATSVVRVS